ncbi:MAG: putative CoA-binding protein [Paracoccaceae bacterium]|jgi:predicted CoA-binding protein
MTQTSSPYSDAMLRDMLDRCKTVAVVGVSPNETRPSFFVARYLKLKGYRIIPVNPVHAGKTLLGATVRASLADIPPEDGEVHMVDIFRRSDQVGPIVDEALAHLGDRGLKAIWMQIGVEHPEAAAKAEAAGLSVVMNRCPKIEYQRLFGELRWGGFNTGMISSKLR